MDEVTEGSVATSWPDPGKLPWNQTQHALSASGMNTISSNGIFEHQHLLFKPSMPCLSGSTVEKQGLSSEDFASSSVLGTTYNIAHCHHQHEDTLLAAHLKQDLRTESAGSYMRQIQSNGLFQPLRQEFLDVPHDLLQKLLRGTLKLPKLERSPSLGSSGEYPSCQEISRTYQPVLPLPKGGALLSSSFSSGEINNSSLISDASPYFAKGPWIDETHNGSLERRFHLSERAHGQQMRSTSQQSPSQPHSATASASGPTRPRTRARRGQATDPHSIAERKRREKISNAMKELQELVPTLNKADRMAFVEDVIEYVRFLQVQTKVFFMSRLGSTGSSLVAETSAQVQDGLEAMAHDLQDYNMVTAEEEIARLLEEDMGEALRWLQSKGLCMMPISLAAVMPIHHTEQPTGLANATP